MGVLPAKKSNMASGKHSKSFKLGRDALTGEFVPVAQAKRSPGRYVIEHVPKAGHGDVPRLHKKHK